jgi:endonuclease/exonuclease/phosphatase family metal-dependent hydrolase
MRLPVPSPRALSALLAAAVLGLAAPARGAPASSADACVPDAAPAGWARTTLDVLTYNIEGLGFPARLGRKRQLARIGHLLAELRAAGNAPDVVLFQEVFSRPARRAVSAAGYPETVHGPRRRQSRELPADRDARQGAGPRSIRNGEIGVKLMNGGLAIASRYPIELHRAEPFARRSCAGLDCLANKGALFARLQVPGVPQPVDIFNTHMNSRAASRAPLRRTLPIHRAQAGELAAFIDAAQGDDHPVILGGDFNARGSEARFEALEPRLPLTLVHRACQAPGSGCAVLMSWDGDAPWMDTQDLQFFRSGYRVQVRPVRVEAMFDGSTASPKLSDHDGYRVVYELSWPVEPAAAGGGC